MPAPKSGTKTGTNPELGESSSQARLSMRLVFAVLFGVLLSEWYRSASATPSNRSESGKLYAPLSRSYSWNDTHSIPTLGSTPAEARVLPMLESVLAGEANITRRDIEVTEELNRRVYDGEFVLLCERPTSRKVFRATLRELCANLDANDERVIKALPDDLLLSDAVKQQFLMHRHKVHQAILEYEVAAMQALDAKASYETRLRTTLSSNTYAIYRAVEARESARRTYQPLRLYLISEGLGDVLDESVDLSLLELIEDSSVLVEDSERYTPFGSLPVIGLGEDAARTSLALRSASLKRSLDKAMNLRFHYRIPQRVFEGFLSYFEAKVN